MKRTYQSGSTKRVRKREKEGRLSDVLNKTQRLDQLWAQTTALSSDSTSIEPEQSSITDGDDESRKLPSLPTDLNVGIVELVESETPSLMQANINENEVTKLATRVTEESRDVARRSTESENFSSDLGEWPPPSQLTNRMREFWIAKGSSECQHSMGPFTKSAQKQSNSSCDRQRFCTGKLFTRVHVNGEKVNRNWLCYSPTSGKVYCFTCKLMSTETRPGPASATATGTGLFASEGFGDWKHADRAISRHERSEQHRQTMIAVVTLGSARGRIDAELAEACETERQYWRNVLARIVAVIKFLAERGLPFRGHDEIIGSTANGNYLGILELAKFDPFLAQHIERYGTCGRGNVSYLSSTICDEFITIMGEHVLKQIVKELKSAKYFSVTVDSTPDISHVDQLTCVVRYVLPDGPVERFVSFLNMHNHTGQELATILLHFLKEKDIDIADCRGQSYDNASNMSGKYNGMQAKIREVNPLALFVACCAHSLNLVGQCAVDCCPAAIAFFDFVQSLYAFFSASTHRWSLLESELKAHNLLVVKRLSDTRWSAHSDAVSALVKGYKTISSLLDKISANDDENAKTRSEAQGLAKKTNKLETGVMAELWYRILQRMNMTSKMLQSPTLDINNAVSLLSSLKDFIASLRPQFDLFERRGQELTSIESFQKKRGRTLYDADNTELGAREVFKVDSFLVIIDKLTSAMSNRIGAYSEVCRLFGFLARLEDLNEQELQQAAEQLVHTYKNDLEPEELLSDELVQFASLLRTPVVKQTCYADKDASKELNMFRLLAKQGLAPTFPNVEIALRIYLCLMVSNCSGERTFSRLKLIKNELRSTMAQKRMNLLSLMSIESDIVRNIDFSCVVEDFALRKSRKTNL